ncbi:uncharacterized protein LOC124204628 [Daphnia pulex]|uniref:uncharacterized protein LOC124204628 n=1 Tax=Daphnia pulex TaxID=6669 RepID=UPI001EDE21A4|nr:uncharacterized protein LOC124204628 [Daphnia pulex]
MASELVHSDGLTPVADNAIVVQSSNASASSFTHSSPTANKEIRGKKMPDNTHGLRFESKLLALFCVRGLGAGYKFELSKEKEDEGGKLEDLIFRYEVPDTTPAGKHWRYRYVQAKHKENEGEKITADHLLGCKRKGESSDSFPKNHLRDYNPKGDFNLTKYFHSFYKIRARGDDIHDCIICTNIGFDENSLKEVGIELVSINNQSEDILKFDAPEKTAHYKLKINNNDWHKQLKEEWSPVQLLAKELKDCATNNKTTQIRTGMLSSYHDALVDEHVIDCTAKKFHQDFVGEVNLSEGARKLRQTICELGVNDSWKDWKFKLSNNFGKGQSAIKNPLPGKITEEDVDNFFDKLIFVVDMPSEEKFENIIETKDVSKYYPNDKCEDQTTQIFDGISKAFIGQHANFWLTSEVAKNILLKNVSKQYKEQLDKKVGFNDDAIKVMEEKLRHLMDTPGREKIQRIATPSPQLTAVKVISAIENLLQELKQKGICQGNCLITPSSLSQDEEDKWKNILKLQKYSHHFLVVVCDNEASVQNHENVFPEGKAEDNNFIIIISRDESTAGIKDEIKYTDLSDNFQKRILSRIVSFQGKNVKVRDLVGDKPEELINFSSTNELLLAENEVKIPSFSTSTFEQSLYVKRTLRFPFENQFELGGECRISSDGHIEWLVLVETEKRKEIWKKIMNGITNQASSTGKPVEDIDLMNLKEKGNEKSIVIISGVAGTGKSTLLSYYYKQIKIAHPDHWVIRINLVDYEAVLKLDQITDLDVVDLIINRLYVVDHKSSFSRSLLRKRLETGDRIVVMFDGFDEINELCQKGAIEWMKSITKDRLIQLYVTTRPHMLDELQFQLSQLAYRLENFTEEDQIKHLTSYWVKELNLSGDIEKPLQQFAKSLVKQVSETLKDEEKSFIGIPLQCKILAECFQSNVKEFITSNCAEVKEEPRESEISDLLDGKKFDLISLFNRLMETKRKVFREEKAKAPSSIENKIVTDAINRLIKDVESHLTQLAIKTIVEDQKIVDILWPPQLSHQSSDDETADEKIIAMNSLSFGLTIENRENDTTNVTQQFLHRTYAEYLFARYLFNGFLLDDKRHNKLLDDKSASTFIVSTILVKREYNGVQVFFNGMLKELVDDDDEWRKRIIKRDLPDRLKTFAEHLYIHILRQGPIKGQMFIRENALLFSLSTGNTMIFTLLCDCLDATLDGKLVQAVMFVFIEVLNFTHFFKVECRCFQRFINYLNFDEGRDMSESLQFFFASNLEYSQWNGEEQQKTVHHLLQFMTNQREAFENYFFL